MTLRKDSNDNLFDFPSSRTEALKRPVVRRLLGYASRSVLFSSAWLDPGQTATKVGKCFASRYRPTYPIAVAGDCNKQWRVFSIFKLKVLQYRPSCEISSLVFEPPDCPRVRPIISSVKEFELNLEINQDSTAQSTSEKAARDSFCSSLMLKHSEKLYPREMPDPKTFHGIHTFNILADFNFELSESKTEHPEWISVDTTPGIITHSSVNLTEIGYSTSGRSQNYCRSLGRIAPPLYHQPSIRMTDSFGFCPAISGCYSSGYITSTRPHSPFTHRNGFVSYDFQEEKCPEFLLLVPRLLIPQEQPLPVLKTGCLLKFEKPEFPLVKHFPPRLSVTLTCICYFYRPVLTLPAPRYLERISIFRPILKLRNYPLKLKPSSTICSRANSITDHHNESLKRLRLNANFLRPRKLFAERGFQQTLISPVNELHPFESRSGIRNIFDLRWKGSVNPFQPMEFVRIGFDGTQSETKTWEDFLPGDLEQVILASGPKMKPSEPVLLRFSVRDRSGMESFSSVALMKSFEFGMELPRVDQLLSHNYPFIMTIYKKVLKEIVLSEQKRRVSFKDERYIPGRRFVLVKRLRPLRMIRFKRPSIGDSFVPLRFPGLKIKAKEVPLKHKFAVQRVLLTEFLPRTNQVALSPISFQPINIVVPKDNFFESTSAIKPELSNRRNLIIKDLKPPDQADPPAFLSPPDWTFSLLNETFRIRVTPFSFGFPSFLQTNSQFGMFSSRHLLVSIKASADCRVKKDDITPTRRFRYISSLDPREPKRWLYDFPSKVLFIPAKTAPIDKNWGKDSRIPSPAKGKFAPSPGCNALWLSFFPEVRTSKFDIADNFHFQPGFYASGPFSQPVIAPPFFRDLLRGKIIHLVHGPPLSRVEGMFSVRLSVGLEHWSDDTGSYKHRLTDEAFRFPQLNCEMPVPPVQGLTSLLSPVEAPLADFFKEGFSQKPVSPFVEFFQTSGLHVSSNGQVFSVRQQGAPIKMLIDFCRDAKAVANISSELCFEKDSPYPEVNGSLIERAELFEVRLPVHDTLKLSVTAPGNFFLSVSRHKFSDYQIGYECKPLVHFPYIIPGRDRTPDNLSGKSSFTLSWSLLPVAFSQHSASLHGEMPLKAYSPHWTIQATEFFYTRKIPFEFRAIENETSEYAEFKAPIEFGAAVLSEVVSETPSHGKLFSPPDCFEVVFEASIIGSEREDPFPGSENKTFRDCFVFSKPLFRKSFRILGRSLLQVPLLNKKLRRFSVCPVSSNPSLRIDADSLLKEGKIGANLRVNQYPALKTSLETSVGFRYNFIPDWVQDIIQSGDQNNRMEFPISKSLRSY